MKKLWRRLGLALLSLILLLAIAGFIVGRWYVAPFLREKMETGVAQASGGLYRLSVGPIHLNFLTGTVRMRNISLSTDSLRWEELRQAKTNKGTPRKINLTLRRLNLVHIGWWEFHKTKNLALDAIEFDHPKLEMTVFKDSTLTAKPEEDTVTLSLLDRLPKLLAKQVKSLKISELSLHNGSFVLRARDEVEKKETVQSSDEVDWLVANVQIAEHDSTRNGKALYADNILFDLNNYRMWAVGGRSLLHVGKLRLIGKDDLLKLSDCTLRNVQADSVDRPAPTLRRPAFRFNIPQIAVRGLDLFRALHRGEMVARAVEIDKPEINLLQNMALPLPLWQKMPNQAFRQVDFPLSVDSLVVNNARIIYREKIEDERGQLTFEQADLLLLNLTNDAHCMSEATPARIYASCQFMGTGDLSVTMEIPLLKPEFECQFRAELENMLMSRLNSMFMPKANLKIEEGFAERVIAKGRIAGSLATGSVSVYYKGLKVTVLDDSTKRKRPFASFLANLAVRKDTEQGNDGEPTRVEGFSYRRDAVDGFLRFIWRSVQSGLVKTLTNLNVKMPKNDGREKKKKK